MDYSSVMVCQQKHEEKKQVEEVVFDPSEDGKKLDLPKNFVWSKEFLVEAQDELDAPIIDLKGVMEGDTEGIYKAAELLKDACEAHGFFMVVNHGVDDRLIKKVYEHVDVFFKQPVNTKSKARKIPGAPWGYSGAHAERFSSNLPWKETFSFPFHHEASHNAVNDHIVSTLGQEFSESGEVFQKYCEAVKELGMKLLEVMAVSLGMDDKTYYMDFFSDGCSIMRCNYYPYCEVPTEAFGTGPHCDPTSITLLHQDHVGGLEVFTDNKWHTVSPVPTSFVINIGDTFMALTNGRYKSSRHRALVNKHKERRSLAFFMCPNGERVIKPPSEIMHVDQKRHYPDFLWSELLNFTQWHYRADEFTLPNFLKFLSFKPRDVSAAYLSSASGLLYNNE